MEKLEELCEIFVKRLTESSDIMTLSVEVNTNSGNVENNVSTVQFDNLQSQRSYTQMMLVGALVLELLKDGRTMSLRDVYYSLKHMFSNQQECNACILNIGALLKLKRFEMNIKPAAKGLIYGRIRFKSQGSNGDWETCENGTIIDQDWTTKDDTDVEVEISSDIRCFILIEKEGIYHRLCEDQFNMRYPCVLICGCGFPDISTRAMVARLNRQYPSIPFLGLCDYNPYGVSLLLTYRFPSRSSHYEGQGHQLNDLKWLGLRNHHIKAFYSTPSPQEISTTVSAGISTLRDDNQINKHNQTIESQQIMINHYSLPHESSFSSSSESNTTSGEYSSSHSGYSEHSLTYSYGFKRVKATTTTTAISNTASYTNTFITSTPSLPRSASSSFSFSTSSSRSVWNNIGHYIMQPLTPHDIRKLEKMISSDTFQNGLPKEYIQELRIMLRNKVKCELEILYNRGLHYLAEFLETALNQHDYI